LAQASLRGTPSAPERLSIVIDGGRLAPAGASNPSPWIVSERFEFHARVDPESVRANPVLDFAVSLTAASAPIVGVLAGPADASVSAKLRGVSDLRPKPLSDRLKELQTAGARLEITRARLARAGAVSVASGDLSLSAAGRLDGLLTVIISGLENLGLGLGGAEIGLALLGKPTELEGKRATALPLRFKDGAVFLGAVPLGKLPPLY
jgi:hypothetical protein